MKYWLLLLLTGLYACHYPYSPPWLEQSSCSDSIPETALAEIFAGVHSQMTDSDWTWTDNDTDFCIAFLTVSNGSTSGRVGMGQGMGLHRAVANAADQLRRQGVKQTHQIKLELVDQVVRINTGYADNLPRSLWGLASDASQRTALLPGEVLAGRLIDSEGQYRPKRLDLWQAWNRERLAAAPIWRYRFTTRSWYSDGDVIVPLYRDHRLSFDLSEQALIAAAASAARYLSNAVGGNGRFVYTYLPKTNRETDRYNILRHAGSIYALLDWYRESGDPEVLNAAQRGLNYLRAQVRPCPAASDMRCVVEKGVIKLGGNALAVLAFSEHYQVTGDRRWLQAAEDLAVWLLRNQADNGKFRPHKWRYPSGEATDFISGYYPGEALYALMRLYRSNGNRRWLKAAQRGADWIIQVRDAEKSIDNLAHDHWLMYALRELYTLDPDPTYLAHAFRITDAIRHSQNLQAPNLRPEQRDWYGSYYRPPRTTPTATRSEALMNAAWLSDSVADRRLPGIANALCAAIRFQLQTQFRGENSLHLPDPGRSRGGFHRSLEDFSIRIDYVQHNLSALLGLIRLQRQGIVDCSATDTA